MPGAPGFLVIFVVANATAPGGRLLPGPGAVGQAIRRERKVAGSAAAGKTRHHPRQHLLASRTMVPDCHDSMAHGQRQERPAQQAMKVASALKISAFAINAVRARDQDRETIETRARRASKFKISFSIAENPLAKKGNYDIYMRVIDPNGNLIIAENKLFQVGREDLQYTYKTAIDFSDDGKLYSFDWTPEEGIKRGTYTFVLYTNGFLMGRASTTLR